MKKLLIIGAGQYGAVAKEIAESLHQFEEISFLDDNHPKAIGHFNDYPKFIHEFDCAFVAIGNNELRLRLIDKLTECGYEVPALIHEKAYVSPSAKIGKGTIIEPMVVLHTEAEIGIGCIISAGTICNHNCRIGNGCHLNCGTIVASSVVVQSQTKTQYGSRII